MKKRYFFMTFMLILIVFASGCLSSNFIKKYGTNITEYDLNLTLNDDHTIDGTQVVKYKNTTSKILGEVCFHTYANSFSDVAMNKPVSKLYETKAYPNGFSSGCIDINEVLCANQKCSFCFENLDKDILKVTLNSPLYPNDFVNIKMTYKIVIPNVLHRFGYSENSINLGNFYPVACVFENDDWDKNPYNSNGDPFYSSIANYNVNITYSNNLLLASTRHFERFCTRHVRRQFANHRIFPRFKVVELFIP